MKFGLKQNHEMRGSPVQADTAKAKVVFWANFDKHFFRQLSDNCISKKLRIKIEFSSINEFFDRCGHKHNVKNQLTFFSSTDMGGFQLEFVSISQTN